MTTHTDRREIMPDPDEERVYQEIHRLYREGKPVRVREHPGGFPAVTVDCEDLHAVPTSSARSSGEPRKKAVRLFGKRLEKFD